MRNLNVIARNETDGFYYPGFVSRPLDDDEISVRFYDIKPSRVARKEIIHLGGAIPCPELKVGDYALVRTMCRTTCAEYYVPAVVVVLPQGHLHDTKFYTLQLYNGGYVNKLRRNIVKIGPEKFEAVFNYIAKLRYGMVRRSISIECLHSKGYLPPKIRRSSSTSSLVMLYPNIGNRTDKIKVLQLHDDIKEPWICRNPKSQERKETPRQSPDSGKSKPAVIQNVHNSIGSSVVPRRVLQTGQEVLARWSDDGWYYMGTIVRAEKDDRYLIMDSTGYTELILREDLLLDSDQESSVIQPFDHVIALHPNYTFSYAPAIVKEDYSSSVTVLFYDKTSRKLPKSEVYKINLPKYRSDVEYIVGRENGLRKCLAIARDDRTGFYEKCEIVRPDGIGQKFIVKWSTGEMVSQAGNQVFLAENLNRSERMINWKYALAPVDDTMSTYLPADVIQTNPFKVKIFNQSRPTACYADQCIWLTEAYFNNSVNYFNNINSDREE